MASDNIVNNTSFDHLKEDKSIQNELFYIGSCMCEAITRLENSYVLLPGFNLILMNHLIKLRDLWHNLAYKSL